MGSRSIQVNRPLVASETIAGEAIIVHHGSGFYFEAAGSAASIWQMIEQGCTAERLASMLTTCYRLGDQAASDTLEQFLALLQGHDLITIDAAAVGTPDFPMPQRAGDFAAPDLRVHRDLADLLLLDPIHDVDASGWPAQRPAA